MNDKAINVLEIVNLIVALVAFIIFWIAVIKVDVIGMAHPNENKENRTERRIRKMTCKERSVLYYMLWLESPTKEFLANYVLDVSSTLKTLRKKGYIEESKGWNIKTYCLTGKGRECAIVYSREIDELVKTRRRIDRKKSMTFGEALELLKKGKKVARKCWNGNTNRFWLELQNPNGDSKITLPYVYITSLIQEKNYNERKAPWTPAQTDMLEQDWVEVE